MKKSILISSAAILGVGILGASTFAATGASTTTGTTTGISVQAK